MSDKSKNKEINNLSGDEEDQNDENNNLENDQVEPDFINKNEENNDNDENVDAEIDHNQDADQYNENNENNNESQEKIHDENENLQDENEENINENNFAKESEDIDQSNVNDENQNEINNGEQAFENQIENDEDKNNYNDEENENMEGEYNQNHHEGLDIIENEEVKADFENNHHKDVSSTEDIINLSIQNKDSQFRVKNLVNKEPKDLTESDYDNLVEWLGTIKFNKKFTMKTINKDFSDGYNYAEILKHFFPKFVEMHNYVDTLNTKKKKINWTTISHKVLRKLSLELLNSQIQRLVSMEKGYVEKHLFNLKERIQLYLKNRESVGADTFLNTTKSFLKPVNCTNFDDTVLLENKLDNVWSDKEEHYRKEIVDRDKIILELKMRLEESEKKYRNCMERKLFLKKELSEITMRIRNPNYIPLENRDSGRNVHIKLFKGEFL